MPNGRSVYKCDQCASVVSPKSAELRLVVETKTVTHPPRKNANPRMKKVDRCTLCKEPQQKHRHLDHSFRSPADDAGGSGPQIVREIRVCRTCFQRAGTPFTLDLEAAWWDRHQAALGQAIAEVGFSEGVDRVLADRRDPYPKAVRPAL